MENELRRGRTLELCWRTGSNLEWIWLDDDIDGTPREWNVVYFAGFRQVRRQSMHRRKSPLTIVLQTKAPSHLEVRLSKHAPTQVVLRDGTKLSEPPAVEGYLWRIKPNTKNRANVYLASHDGNLFTMALGKLAILAGL